MIDLSEPDRLIALSDLPDSLPKVGGKKVNKATCYRWAQVGRRGAKLETARLGQFLFTTMEAVQEFSDAQAKGKGKAAEPKVSRAAVRANQELKAMGL